jgi:mono/diheme cytochrome c family protein
MAEQGIDAGASDCPPTEIVSDVSDKATLSGIAVNLVLSYCGPCHSPGGAQRVPEGPANVADFNLMIDEAFVVDCSADLSPIITSMSANEMPPPGYLPFSVRPDEIDLIGQFIELDCSDEEKACAISPSEPGCDDVLSARRERRSSR